MNRLDEKQQEKPMAYDNKAIDALWSEALSDNFQAKIPFDFADRLEKTAQQISLKQFWQEELLKQFSFFGGIAFLIAVAFGIFYYLQPQNALQTFEFLTKIRLMIIGTVVLIFSFQLADTWVFRKLNRN